MVTNKGDEVRVTGEVRHSAGFDDSSPVSRHLRPPLNRHEKLEIPGRSLARRRGSHPQYDWGLCSSPRRATSFTRISSRILVASALAVSFSAAMAQSADPASGWPSRPLRVVV